jgi:polar amino acid transport system substrate-binding protein
MRTIGLACILACALRLGAQGLAIYCEDDPPNQFLAADGKLTGLTVEIVEAIQRRVGTAEPIQLVPWARGYDAALNRPNTVLFSVARTAERNPRFHWVGPVLEMTFSFYARADSALRISSLEDAKRLKRIGVYNNDVRDTFLTQAGFRNLDRTNNNLQNVKKLMAGRIDVYASSPAQIDDEARAAGYKGSDVKEVFAFMRVQLFIVMSRGTPDDVVKAWSGAFAAMQKDGSFATLFRKYYPKLIPPERSTTPF